MTAIDDERRGEELVVLCANLPIDTAELASGLAARDLPALFRPKPAHYVVVDAIPKLGTGKTDLGALRNLARAALARAQGRKLVP